MRRRTKPGESDAAAAADSVLRLSVLLRAGVAPGRAWTFLADAGDAVAVRVCAAVAAGDDTGEALSAAGGPWRDVGAAWRVATTVGAPLAESLRDVASALRDGQQAADEVRVALAEPAATARLMSWLPLVAVGLGFVLGFDTVTVLAANPLGIACLVGGVALIVVARRWTAALVRRAQPTPGIPGMDAELTAIALGGGVSIDRARALVSEQAATGGSTEVDEILGLSTAAGVPAVDLLRSSAWLARHRARTDGRLRAAALSSRLLLPLGVCTLPAFLLLGVAPMLLSILSSGVLVV
ncbi:type II secretion system F family protein [Microbacterium sp. P07]|uniref:type II secretion system F family protein n=1 Tax=Microbacterium sp. P07 TaxID=3366952 RepID=UPI003745A75B